MAQLKDYDLQRGDWVKIKHPFSNSYIWTEFKSFDNRYYFQELDHTLHCTHEVKAVLRPSVVIRDELDSILGHNPEVYINLPKWMHFELIHAKQERVKVDTHDEMIQYLEETSKYGYSNRDKIHYLCREIDKLKDKVK